MAEIDTEVLDQVNWLDVACCLFYMYVHDMVEVFVRGVSKFHVSESVMFPWCY